MRLPTLFMTLLLPLLLTAEEPSGVEQLFAVKTVKVTQTDAAGSQTNYGYVRADEGRMTDVAPRFGGYVEALYADTRYFRVQKGQPLAKVYSPEVLQAKEDYLTALRFNDTRPSAEMVDSVRTKLELLGVSRDEIEAVRKTKRAGATTTLYAPASGWIFENRVREGAAFKAGTTLFTIVNLDRVWVEANIYQQELPRLAALTDFTVRATGAEKAFSAEKALLYPDIDSGTATAILRLVVDNPDGILLPGMYAMITASAAATRMLTLPRSAVIRKNGAWYVFRAGDFKGIYDPAKVEVRPLDKERFEVVSGLHAGDEVADDAMFLLDADAQISGLE